MYKLKHSYPLLVSVILSASPTFAKDISAQQKTNPTPIQADKSPYAKEAISHYNKAVELHQSGFLDQAIIEYRAALAADDRMDEAWCNLAEIYAAQCNYREAFEAFDRALALQPNKPITLNRYATVLYQYGNVEDAKDEWRKALEIDPGFGPALSNFANALRHDSDPSGRKDLYDPIVPPAKLPFSSDYRDRIEKLAR